MQTEMTDSATQSAREDQAAVTAVRGGDAERYRELVERHERRVFAVAWSWLGDGALAEEVTQEAFIRAYRRLWLLGDGAKFAGWVSTIARRIAINFGLRHRRELNKRERWALENPAASTAEDSAADTDPLYTPETLRQTLAELPAAHRECLVLFYLEGKSGTEAAVVLGISEAAFRVRLHRARGALRERLEDKLAGSLRKLRPARTLVPGVMAAVLVSASAKAATAGATVLGTLAKFAPFKLLFSFLPFLFMLPGVLFSWLVLREEASNYRDQGGFRARLFNAGMRRWVFGFAGFMVMVFVVIRFSTSHLSQRTFYGLLAVFLLFSLANNGRLLAINRSRYAVINFIGGIWLAAGLVAICLGWLPQTYLSPLIMVQMLAALYSARYKPMRQDYSLFVREAEGMLWLPEGDAADAPRLPTLTKSELFAFARFLGSRWLVNNFRRQPDGLVLRLTSAKSSPWELARSFLFGHWSAGSSLTLGPDGSVRARLHGIDRQTLNWLYGGTLPSDAELEDRVGAVAESAWAHFRAGQIEQAERAVGQTPDADVFIKPLGRTRYRRASEILVLAAAGVVFSLMGVVYLCPEALAGLKPVAVTEAQVRAFLNDTRSNPDHRKFKFNSAGLALFKCLVLPSTNLFNAEGLRAMRDEVAENGGFDLLRTRERRASWVFGAPLARRAVADGWISWSDLGIQPQDAASTLRNDRFQRYSTEQWDILLTRCESWSWVKSERYPVMRIRDDGLTQLRLLRVVNCLDLVDREALIRAIAEVQVLSATPAPGQPPIHDWRDVRGLFFTPCWPALLDTYFSLATLEILGGLDRIDREQCIRGILRRHRGKGFLTSPDSGGYNEYHIEGDARDTFAAFESLRILGALDRVKDLERWQFRPQRRGVAKGQLAWNDVEAWVCQQRLEKLLRNRKANPKAPVRSLLLD